MVFGELEIGTEARPHTSKATITLTDKVKDEQLMGMGDRGIMLSGGTLNLHGNRSNAWTKLARTAEAGSNTIEVLTLTNGRWVTRLSSPQQITIRDRPRHDISQPSAATPSHWMSPWNTCTTARSPSGWMSAAKWVC